MVRRRKRRCRKGGNNCEINANYYAVGQKMFSCIGDPDPENAYADFFGAKRRRLERGGVA